MWWKLGAAAVVTTGALLYNSQKIVDIVLVSSCYPRDEVVGDAKLVELGELSDRMHTKRALVVGGTKGIGRGVARTMASAGVEVWVMGRTAGPSHVEMLAAEAMSLAQVVNAVPGNLYTKEGCVEAVRTVKEMSPEGFDYVVFTVGQWPDRNNPNTEKGVNKVLALDVYARFTLFEELRKNGLLNEGGRVMSVLASTGAIPMQVTPELAKEVLSQGKKDFNKGGLKGLLTAATIANDSFLFNAAARYPSFYFIGTHPGLVQTELLSNSNAFPSWVTGLDPSNLLKVTELESGRRICSILSSPNVKNRNYSYFNQLGQGRKTHELAYDKDLGDWLWDHMEKFGEI